MASSPATAGVLIYNGGTSYAYNATTGAVSDGGTFGAIAVSGNGQLNVTALTSGAYAGIGNLPVPVNTQPLNLSGNNVSSINGSVYAPDAQLTLSGNAQLKDALIVSTMNLSGNAIFNDFTASAPAGTTAFSPAQLRTAYGVNSLALDGTGQTIAIVDAYDDPAIYQGLDQFDSQFAATAAGPTLYAQYGPASTFLTVLNQAGQATPLPATDPSGAGNANWETEEAVDVEWAHAMAPGAQIVLVEANSQALSDLMSSVATAAAQPGVSVVSMSWGFSEGQAVLAADEAAYDQDLITPAGHQGVTFVASTGDYGTNEPEYPAFSPNVVAVGGTSLNLNSDNSYSSETGWGYNSSSAGTLIASGGGVSQFETEPAYQQGVQSTGYRTTPDVSFVADPNTGAWVSDTYNLAADNSFEVVGGTSLSAPSWAGLLALVNQGRAADGAPTLNSSSPTEAQQDLYSLSQNDYNVISSGTNGGYNAAPGYNLVTGLGTPVVNLLVPDLVAGNYPSSGQVAPISATLNANAGYSGGSGGGAANVMNVFDAITVTGDGLGHGQDSVAATDTAVDRHGAATVAEETPALQLQTRAFLVSTPSINPNLIGFIVAMPPSATATTDTGLGSANQTLYAVAAVNLPAAWHDRRAGFVWASASTEMTLAASRGVADYLPASAGEASLAPVQDEVTSVAADAPAATPGSPGGRLSGTVSALWDEPAATLVEDWAGDMLAAGGGSDGLLFGSIVIFAGVTAQELAAARSDEPDEARIRKDQAPAWLGEHQQIIYPGERRGVSPTCVSAFTSG